jgi:N-acetylglucosamine-6-phosphate deacetylase
MPSAVLQFAEQPTALKNVPSLPLQQSKVYSGFSMSLVAIAAGKILTPLEAIENGLVLIEDGSIRAVGSREGFAVPSGARFVDLGERLLAPGFIDVHIHGGAGRDVMEATPDALQAVARMLAEHGTTSFFPTTLTATPAAFLRSLQGLGSAIASWRGSSGEPLAEPLGVHLEGPFLSEPCRGAHPREHLQKPSLHFLRQCLEAGKGFARILTVAPELEGALEVQSEALRAGVKVALGHSSATYEQAERAIEAGASHAVHVFNAMRPFAHRDPGILGAVLTDDRVVAEVIADGVHVSAPALRLLLRAKRVSGIVLVTDAVSATGMCPGRYTLGEMEISLGDDPRSGLPACRNAEGKLAGSVLTQDRAVRNMAASTGASFRDAVQMATLNPARLLGLEHRKGCLQPGADADLVVLEPGGAVSGVMAGGVGNFL